MKIYSKYILSLSILAMAGMGTALTGCNDSEDIVSSFKADERNFALDYDGLMENGEQAGFKLSATSDWKVIQKDNWLSLSRESGTPGSYNLFITAEENLTGEDRQGFIEIEMAGKVEQIAVTQKMKVTTLIVRPSTIDVNALGLAADGNPVTFTVETNSDWTIALPEGCDWVVLDKTEGHKGKAEVTATVAMNATGADRSAALVVTAAEKTAKVTVKQSGNAFTVTSTSSQLMFEASDPAGLTINATVNCVEGWKVKSAPEWVSINPAQGEAGSTPVVLTATANAGDPREGKIVLESEHNLTTTFAVSQKTDKLMPDTKAVGYEYYSDDFAWCVGGADQISHINGGAPYDARNIYTWDFTGNGYGDVLAAFNQRYTDLHADAKTCYAMDGYIKFNKGNTQTAIQIKNPLPIESGKFADVELSFLAARNGTDDMSVTVLIEGDGEIVGGQTATKSQILEPVSNTDKTIPWTWKTLKVTIKGATATTKITIGETHFIENNMSNVSGQHRWFMDNLKVTRIANL